MGLAFLRLKIVLPWLCCDLLTLFMKGRCLNSELLNFHFGHDCALLDLYHYIIPGGDLKGIMIVCLNGHFYYSLGVELSLQHTLVDYIIDRVSYDSKDTRPRW